MGAQSVPRREVVTARPAARDRAESALHRPPAPERTPEADARVRTLMRRQLSAGLAATALLAVLLGLLPLLLRLLPLPPAAPRVPLAVWLVLGAAPYPALVAIGAWYVRRAERNERAPAAPARPERP